MAGGRPRSRYSRSPIRGGRSPTPPRIRDERNNYPRQNSRPSTRQSRHSPTLSPLRNNRPTEIRGGRSPSPAPLKRPKAYRDSRSRSNSPLKNSDPPPLPNLSNDLPPLPPAENETEHNNGGYDYGFEKQSKRSKTKKSGWKTVNSHRDSRSRSRSRSLSPRRKSRTEQLYEDEEREFFRRSEDRHHSRERSRDRGRSSKTRNRTRSSDRRSSRHSSENEVTEFQPIVQSVNDNRKRSDSSSSSQRDKKVVDWREEVKKNKPSGPLLKPKPDFAKIPKVNTNNQMANLNPHQQQAYTRFFI